MKIELWVIGKTKPAYLKEGISVFEKRIARYHSFSYVEFPDKKRDKTNNEALQKSKESQLVLSKLEARDYLILLDENGKQYTSLEFASFLEKRLMDSGNARILFLVGGAYGFDEKLYRRANQQLSLSKLTFSHQMVRLFFLEQLYRAFTILKNEPYHNE